MKEIEIAHRLRTLAAEMDDLATDMKAHQYKAHAWTERAADMRASAIYARQWATHIEQGCLSDMESAS